jgi:glycosyltransferase involved in cell wall biosynthesis
MAKEIAYIVKGFPRLSETFITNEVLQLEKAGAKIKLFSIKRPDEQLQQNTVEQLSADVIYLPQVSSVSNTFLLTWLLASMRPFLKAHFQLLYHHPFAFITTLAQVIIMTFIYRKGRWSKPRKIYIKEFIQAVFIANQIRQLPNIAHIHAHFCHGATTIALIVSRMTNIPFSFTAHAKDIYQNDQNPGNLLLKKINAASFVATCTGANKQHLNSLGNADKIKLIYHGLDVNYFKPATSNNSGTESAIYQILSVGRYVEKKGFIYLLEACSMLKNRGLKFHCRIIGEHGEAYAQLQQAVTNLQLEKQVALEGPKPHDQLMQIYQQSQIFVLPCQIVNDGDRDGIPNVLVEAMASGLAVISTRISGIPELIKHQHNGLLVTEKNSRELANAIEQLINDSASAEQYKDHGRATVLQYFDSSKTTLKLKRLFDQCLDKYSQATTRNQEVSRVNT